jgi:hypothetical protein
VWRRSQNLKTSLLAREGFEDYPVEDDDEEDQNNNIILSFYICLLTINDRRLNFVGTELKKGGGGY